MKLEMKNIKFYGEYKCRKCDSDNIAADIIVCIVTTEHSPKENKFDTVNMSVQVCWCTDCGEPHSSLILDVVEN